MNDSEFDYLGPYRVDRIIGRGGMGSVYKGFHAKSNQPVAIKVIASGIANQSRFRRRFAAEIEALKRLKHPHIVELYGYGEEQGMLFYSMEYVQGQSLHEHLRHQQQIRWQDVVQVGIETTAALKHAHDLGIIHRDLKPANLMLTDEGKIKLTDFGIAKLFGSGDETAAGSVIGTADYMPPEQAEGKPVTVRSDLYSVGCVMFALLAGKPPFSGRSVPEVLYAVRYNAPPDLAKLVPDAPQELVELIHQLLSKDPLRRPPTALVVNNRLKALQQAMRRQEDESSESPPPPAPRLRDPVGTELTSLDLSDIEDEELKLTGEELDAMGLSDDPPKPPRKRSADAEDPESPPEETPGAESSEESTHERPTLLAPDSLIGDSDMPTDEASQSMARGGTSVDEGHSSRDADIADEDASSREVQADDKSSPRAQGRKRSSADEQRNRHAPRSRTGRSSVAPGVAKSSRVSHEASFEGLTDEPESHANSRSEKGTSGGPSHYTPVENAGASDFRQAGTQDDASNDFDWLQYGSIALIVLLLVTSLGTVWWMLLPESSDDLYERIMTAANSADDGRLLAVSGDVDEFLERFPNDERAKEIQALEDEADLIRRTKILQRKAARAGGVNELPAIEQAFLECMQTRSENFGEAQERLLAFIEVFARMENLDASDRRLLELAEFAFRVGENLTLPADPVAKQQLEEMVAAAEASLSSARLESFYRNLLMLYRGKPWASQQLERIRAKLEQPTRESEPANSENGGGGTTSGDALPVEVEPLESRHGAPGVRGPRRSAIATGTIPMRFRRQLEQTFTHAWGSEHDREASI